MTAGGGETHRTPMRVFATFGRATVATLQPLYRGLPMPFSIDWPTTKTKFYELSLKKKPKEKLGGVVKSSHTGLSKTIGEVDAAQKAVDVAVADLLNQKTDPPSAQKVLAVLVAKHKAFVTAKDKYLK